MNLAELQILTSPNHLKIHQLPEEMVVKIKRQASFMREERIRRKTRRTKIRIKLDRFLASICVKAINIFT